MRRLNPKPEDLRAFRCPQCEKSRMNRVLKHEVSLEKREYKTKDNATVSLFIDICDNCKKKNWHKYFEPTRADVKRVLKAMRDESELGEESLEDLL